MIPGMKVDLILGAAAVFYKGQEAAILEDMSAATYAMPRPRRWDDACITLR